MIALDGTTPYPWKLTIGGELSPWDGKEMEHVGILGSGDEDVLQGCGDCGSPWIKKPGDLRLIGAAPELYAALRALVRRNDEKGYEHSALINEARLALAKAEGPKEEEPPAKGFKPAGES